MILLPKAIAGIDPGASGALCLLSRQKQLLDVIRFEKLSKFAINKIVEAYIQSLDIIGIKEQAHARPKDRKSLKRLFETGKNDGFATDLFEFHGIEYIEIDPKKWQYFHKLGGIPTYEERKRQSKIKAQEIFPGVDITLDMAEAMLIAHYGWHLNYGENVL